MLGATPGLDWDDVDSRTFRFMHTAKQSTYRQGELENKRTTYHP